VEQLRAAFPRRRAAAAALARLAKPSTVALLLACSASVATLAPAQQPGASTPAPEVAAAPAQPAAAGFAAVFVQPKWSQDAVKDLLDAVDDSAKEGLTPADYAPDTLRRLVETDADQNAIDAAATRTALMLAHDYLLGRVGDKAQYQWFIERSPYDTLALRGNLANAVERGDVRKWLTSLLPDNQQYRDLRDRLAATGPNDTAERQMLRANLERWRWMPRQLGTDYVYVNVPAYQLALVDNGSAVAHYDVVVGKKDTPTPQLAVEARSVVVNPWWTLPPSVIKEKGLSGSRRGGFVYSGGSLRQPPGPRNALGRVKVDMPNEHAIYLHDTPAKGRFAEASRAFSHGCVRVKDIDSLAERIMEMGTGDPTRVDSALATTRTATLKLPQGVPVYIVYFTAESNGAGGLVTHEDPYGRDAQVISALDRPTQYASLDLR